MTLMREHGFAGESRGWEGTEGEMAEWSSLISDCNQPTGLETHELHAMKRGTEQHLCVCGGYQHHDTAEGA